MILTGASQNMRSPEGILFLIVQGDWVLSGRSLWTTLERARADEKLDRGGMCQNSPSFRGVQQQRSRSSCTRAGSLVGSTYAGPSSRSRHSRGTALVCCREGRTCRLRLCLEVVSSSSSAACSQSEGCTWPARSQGAVWTSRPLA